MRAAIVAAPSPSPAAFDWVTSTTAPWWSALAGIVVGAVIAGTISVVLARGNRKHELKKIAVEAEQGQRAAWRSDVLAEVLRMIETAEIVEVEMKTRALDFDKAFVGERGWMVNEFRIKDEAVEMDNANQDVLQPLRDQLRHSLLRLQILRAGDIASAAKDLDHHCRHISFLQPMAAVWVRCVRIGRSRYYLQQMAEMHLSPFVSEPSGMYETFVANFEREHPVRMFGMTPDSEVDVNQYWDR
jgi:hypothetical protein